MDTDRASVLRARLSWDMPRDLPPEPSKWDRHLAGRWLRDLARRFALARAIRRLVFRKPDDTKGLDDPGDRR